MEELRRRIELLEKMTPKKDDEDEKETTTTTAKGLLANHLGGLSTDGLEYVWFGEDFPTWARATVGVVFFVGLSVMAYMIYLTAAEYLTYPFATTIHSETRYNAKWPAVTICANHPEVSYKKMEHLSEELSVEMYSSDANTTFIKSMIRHCMFYHSACDGNETGTTVHDFWYLEDLGEKHGLCLEFNYHGAVDDQFCSSDEECVYGLYGAHYGLNVFVDPSFALGGFNASHEFDASHVDTRYEGVYVALHGKMQEAMPTYNNVVTGVGVATFISMSERETRRLSTPYHAVACSDDLDYSKSTCMEHCEEDIEKKCKFDHSKTLYENLHGDDDNYGHCFHDEIQSEICQCQEECTSQEWIPEISQTIIHGEALKLNMLANLDPPTFGEVDTSQFSHFHLYYRVVNLEVVEETPIYNIFMLVGVVAGHIGFFTGFNVITCVQILLMTWHLLLNAFTSGHIH